MHTKQTLISWAMWLLFGLNLLNGQGIPEVKREFRGVWVSSISNLDYPSRPTVEYIAHQEEFRILLDQYKSIGLNAVIVQIRPAGDAFYPSALAPWSRYLTGIQGKPPIPEDFDPLKMMIEETHKRGMEFHAWLNPFRATVDLDTLSLAPNHAFKQHRKWMMRYGNRFFFNPALPDVRNHLTEVVAEVVENYEVDAIHFDDYFYPYPEKGWGLPDSTDFKFYGVGFRSIEDWRRSNVDALIEGVSARIKSIKPYVRFGVSPFGVWRNKSKDSQWGSDTRAGVTCYDDLYADVLKWMRNGWIDYVAPQLYWHIGFSPADHLTLLNWWSSNVQDCQLYVGHAAYKVGNNAEPAWNLPIEIPRQILFNRRTAKCLGSAYFRSKFVLQNPIGLRDSLKHYYRFPALPPEQAAMELPAVHAPEFGVIWPKQGNIRLKWRPSKEDLAQLPYYYVIYRFNGDQVGDLNDPRNILSISSFGSGKRKFKFIDETAKKGQTYTYAVTAVSRQHSESKPSKARAVLKRYPGVRWVRVQSPKQEDNKKP